MPTHTAPRLKGIAPNLATAPKVAPRLKSTTNNPVQGNTKTAASRGSRSAPDRKAPNLEKPQQSMDTVSLGSEPKVLNALPDALVLQECGVTSLTNKPVSIVGRQQQQDAQICAQHDYQTGLSPHDAVCAPDAIEGSVSTPDPLEEDLVDEPSDERIIREAAIRAGFEGGGGLAVIPPELHGLGVAPSPRTGRARGGKSAVSASLNAGPAPGHVKMKKPKKPK